MQICPSCGEENPPRFRLCGFCGTALAPELPPQEVRKTVTIVFSDLKGSTKLGEALDPESLREVMTRYFDSMRGELERHGGTIEKFIGDAVMAVFGLPQLHEDDALRAVKAAAGMQTALARLNGELEERWGVTLANRTGVNTGEVVAGDPTTGQRLVTGDAVNVAARLEQAAGECEVLLGDTTYRLVRHAVEVEAVEPLELKGKSERVPAYRLLTVGEGDSIVRHQDSALVGRRGELSRLGDAFTEVSSRSVCRLVTLLGEAGLGKSRLTEEFVRSVTDDAAVLRGRCLPYGRGITFWPLVEVVRQAAGIGDDDGPELARRKLAAVGGGLDDEVVERVASTVGISDTSFSLQELFWGTRKLVEALARQRPVVLVIEDIHWAEATLLDLIEHLNGSVEGVPLLILCGARPTLLEQRDGWSASPIAELIELQPLSDEESERVIANLLGETGLADEAQGRIVAAAEGNPLFVEQMLSMMIEEGHVQRVDGKWVATGDLSELVVPPTINALLSARLDLLTREERSTIEPASVIGLVFEQPAVEELAPDVLRSTVGVQLTSLTAKRLLVSQAAAAADEQAFRFQHILIKDAAYNGLLKRARASFHVRFVDWAERVNRDRDRELEFEEILGYHLEQAYQYLAELGPLDDHGRDVGGRASDRLGSAGRRALARGDMPAAANLLRRAVELLPSEDPRRVRMLPDLYEALLEIGEFAWAELYVDEAAEAGERTGDAALGAQALLGRLLLHRYVGEEAGWSSHALEDTQQAIEVLEAAGDHLGVAKGYRLLYFAHGTACRFAEFQEAAERAGQHARLAGDRRLERRSLTNHATAALYGPTPVPEAILRCREIRELAEGDRRETGIVTCLLAEALAMNGEFTEARAAYAQGRAMLDDLGRGLVAPMTSLYAAAIELHAGDPEAAERRLRPDYETLTQLGESYFSSSIAALFAHVLYALERDDEAEELARVAADLAPEDDIATQAYSRSALAKVRARRDADPDAIELASEGVELLRDVDALVWKADALRALGEVFVLLERPAEAREVRVEALELYERKQSLAAAATLRASLSGGAGDPARVLS